MDGLLAGVRLHKVDFIACENEHLVVMVSPDVFNHGLTTQVELMGSTHWPWCSSPGVVV